MTSIELRATLERLGMSQAGLASMTGRKAQTIRQWAIGRSPVPNDVAEWLRWLDATVQSNPPPRRGDC